ncbi:MAG: type II toxin-antitoxin system RelE/ParE family toxin [Terrimicrobiaceae bacterium]
MSRAYRLSSGAESDIRQILEYTLDRWGAKQAAKYAASLETALGKLAAGEIEGREFSGNLPGVRVYRCEHHYIFFQPLAPSLVVLAILHEQMDLTSRLSDRPGYP